MLSAGKGGVLRRLGLFYVLILLAGIWVVTNRRYSVEEDTIVLRTGDEAVAEADALVALFAADGQDGLAAYLEGWLERQKGVIVGEERYYRLEDADGEVLVGNIPNWAGANARELRDGVLVLEDLWRPNAREWWRLWWLLDGDYNPDLDLVVVKRILDGGGVLYVGRDTEFLNDLHTVYRVSSWALILVAVVGLIAGMMSSRSLLKSLGKINAMAGTIVRTRDLSRRIPEEGLGVDFKQTVGNLNTMLEKIEDSVAGIRQASNSIAHDLRTPLTRLRNRLETMSVEDRGATAEEVSSLVSEVDSVLSTFRSILHISQLEMGKDSLRMEPVDLLVVLTDAVEMYEPVVAEREQRIEQSLASAMVNGERNLLMQLASNLIDNASKYGPEGAVVWVSCGVADAGVYLEIRDEGEGICAADRERVFDRFYRAEASRSSEGVGLGLSMVAAIVKAHRGRIELSDGEPGLKVRVWFDRV